MDGDLRQPPRPQTDPDLAHAEAPTPVRDHQAAPATPASADTPEKPPKPGWKKALYWLIAAIAAGALIVGIALYWLEARHYENTDDAFIDGRQSQVSAQVGAKVITLAVDDNQPVHAGDMLLQLDPRDFKVKLDQARAQRAQAAAQLLQAQAGLLQQQATIDQAEANVRVTEADLGQQQTDLARYRAIDPKAITRQQLDTATAQTRSAAARLDANKQAVGAARAQLEAQKAQVEAARANVQAADATIENAELQLSYATVQAPIDGRVTKMTVEVGNYVNPGQSLLAIMPDTFWVTANFKETQLALMRPGQPVSVRVDACPGVALDAHVDSVQSGTGAVFSSLPAENATGNYVKVVQRVPVKIVFDKQPDEATCRLLPGLSVAPRVTVRP
jgi:membrane fusion protein (multidrug efflux system)